MIQATDFVCPKCKAQVGKSCVEFEKVFSFGSMVSKPIHRFGKPHAERRNLAKLKRESARPGNSPQTYQQEK